MIVLTSSTTFPYEFDAFFPWNIFCISTNSGQSIILCPLNHKYGMNLNYFYNPFEADW
jgi:hypothetical protein